MNYDKTTTTQLKSIKCTANWWIITLLSFVLVSILAYCHCLSTIDFLLIKKFV